MFLPWVYTIPRPFPARRHQQLLNPQLGLGTPAGRVTHVSHEEVLLWHIQDCKGNGVEMVSKCISCCICWSQITSMKLCFQWTKKTALIIIGTWQAQEVRIRIWHPNTGRVTNDQDWSVFYVRLDPSEFEIFSCRWTFLSQNWSKRNSPENPWKFLLICWHKAMISCLKTS